MIFSGYTIIEIIAGIAFTAFMLLILLFAFTEIMQRINSEKDKENKYIMWENIQKVLWIFFLVDFIFIIGLYCYLPNLF